MGKNLMAGYKQTTLGSHDCNDAVTKLPTILLNTLHHILINLWVGKLELESFITKVNL